MKSLVNRKKPFIVSPFALRKGAVVQWETGLFHSSGQRFEGKIQSLSRNSDGNIVMHCYDVVDLSTGELRAPSYSRTEPGTDVLSLSFVDKLVSMPESGSYLLSDVDRVRSLLRANQTTPYRNASQTPLEQEIAAWTDSTPRSTLSRAVEQRILEIWDYYQKSSFEHRKYFAIEWLTSLTILIALKAQLQAGQPASSLLLTTDMTDFILPLYQQKTLRRKNTGVEYINQTGELWELPSLSVLRKHVKKHLNRMRFSHKKSEAEARARYRQESNKMLDAMMDYDMTDDDVMNAFLMAD